MEPAVAVLMSLATLGTAWSSYQSAAWTRTANGLMNQANALERQAAVLDVQGSQTLIMHAALFMQIIAAKYAGNPQLEDFYVRRLPPDARQAYDAWLAQDPFKNPAAAPHPFVADLYTVRGAADSAKARADATQRIDRARAAGLRSGQYLANTVLFAAMLFFAAMSGRFEQPRVRLLTFVFAAILFAIAATRTLALG